jgi:PST family polysaccharide transporter
MGSSELGIFSSTIRLVELFYFVPVIFQTTYNGHFLQTLEDKSISQKKMFSITLIVFYISLLVSIFFLFFSSTVLMIIYGNTDAQNALLLNLYSICFIMVSIGTIRNIRINSIGASKFYMYITFLGVLLNITSNLIFIPRYGILGCAISAIISQFFVSILSSLFHPILREDLIFFIRNVFKFKQYKNHFNLN